MSDQSAFGEWCTAANEAHYWLPGLPLPLCGKRLKRGEETPHVTLPGSLHAMGGKLVLPHCEACLTANLKRWEKGGAA